MANAYKHKHKEMDNNPQEILKELHEQIKIELALVNETDTPVVFSMTKTEEGVEKLLKQVSERVLNGSTISAAILDVEGELNINRID